MNTCHAGKGKIMYKPIIILVITRLKKEVHEEKDTNCNLSIDRIYDSKLFLKSRKTIKINGLIV